MENISRRSAFGLVLSALAPTLANAGTPPGLISPPKLRSVLNELSFIQDGSGLRELYIVVSPSCDKARSMIPIIQHNLQRLRVKWVPSCADESQTNLLATLFNINDITSVYSFMDGSLQVKEDIEADARAKAERQNLKIRTDLAYMEYSVTARPLATPTLIYKSDGLFRIVRGSVKEDLFNEIVGSIDFIQNR